jgi:peptidoglycan/LPS O-acetylase OafA/YrhL
MSLVLSKYRLDIDGLRGVAIASVFIFHLNKNLLPGGFVGVDVFFVISGYLISSIIIKECEQHRFSLSKFYQRRIARIFPVFYTVTLATLVGSYFVYSPVDFASTSINSVAAALSLANIKFALQGDYFQLSADALPLLHYWSLSVEEQFYIIFPLLLSLGYRSKLSKRAIGWCVSICWIISFVACVYLTSKNSTLAFFLMPTRAWELLTGSLLALYIAHNGYIQNRRINYILSIVGLIAVIIACFTIQENNNFPGFAALLPVIGTTLLIGTTQDSFGVVNKFLSSRPLIFLGRISYSLYLWHWPIFSLIDYGMYTTTNNVRILLKISISIIISICSYFYIEQPARCYLNQPKRKLKVFSAAIIITLLLTFCGSFARSEKYLNATEDSVINGGIAINEHANNQNSIVLMGDSNASMYGEVTKDIAKTLDIKANIVSVAGGDALPSTKLWSDSLQTIIREKPQFTIFVESWVKRLQEDRQRLDLAIAEITKHSNYIILITQPPILPKYASRENFRQSGFKPIVEEAAVSTSRKETNNFIKSKASDRTVIIDIEPLFTKSNGEIKFTSNKGQQLYQDDGHLSGYGSDLVRNLILKEIINRLVVS